MDRTNLYDAQLAVTRRYVHLYRDTDGARAAFQLAGLLMQYRADTALGADVKLEQAWATQRDRGAKPEELIARVCAFMLWMDHRPGYFRNERAEAVALGRLCLHCEPLGGHRYNASVYAPAGRMVRHHLGPFAISLLRKINSEAQRVADLRKKSANLETSETT